MIIEMDMAGSGGGAATGTIDWATAGDVTPIDTGLSEINHFYFSGQLHGDSDYCTSCCYEKRGSGFAMSSMAGYLPNGNLYGQSVYSSFPAQQQYAPVVTGISGGVVTLKGGSAGSWGTLEGTWFAD